MTRREVEELVERAEPITVAEMREVRDAPGVSALDFINVWSDPERPILVMAVHFVNNSAGVEL